MIGEILKKNVDVRTAQKVFEVIGKFYVISFRTIARTAQSIAGAIINLTFEFSTDTILIDGQRVRIDKTNYNIVQSKKSYTGRNSYLCSEAP